MQSEIFNGFILPTDALHKCVSGMDVQLSLQSCLPSTQKLCVPQHPINWSMGDDVPCNLILQTWEVERGRLQVQCHPQLHSECEVKLSYVNPALNKVIHFQNKINVFCGRANRQDQIQLLIKSFIFSFKQMFCSSQRTSCLPYLVEPA